MSDLSRRQYRSAARFYRFRHVVSILAGLGVVLSVSDVARTLIGA